MDIKDLKTHLKIDRVLAAYGMQADKNNRVSCPFHNDKTPSMQVYPNTNTLFCFSSNCKLHGKAIDGIDFIMYKENISKHEALLKAKQIVTQGVFTSTKAKSVSSSAVALPPAVDKRADGGTEVSDSEQSLAGGSDLSDCNQAEGLATNDRTAFLERIFTYFTNGLNSSTAGKEYLLKRSLDYKALAAMGNPLGYNTAQWHHGARKDDNLIKQALACGLMYEYGTNNRTGGTSYGCFGKYGICFALRNKENKVTGMYFRSTLPEQNTLPRGEGRGGVMKHYYLKDRQGLYPNYPSPQTKKLILTEAIIDAATLLQIPLLTSQYSNLTTHISHLNTHYSILACYGTNGLTPEHKAAISELKELNEIIFAFDNDDAGTEGVNKYSKELHELLPGVQFSKVSLPPGEDVNEFFIKYDAEALQYLINERKFVATNSFSFSNEKTNGVSASVEKEKSVNNENGVRPVSPLAGTAGSRGDQGGFRGAAKLNTTDPEQIHYNTSELLITLLGGININSLDRLRVTLYIRRNPHVNPGYSLRQNIDLYQDDLVEKTVRRAAEKLDISSTVIGSTLAQLTEELEQYRMAQIEAKKKEKKQKKELNPYEIEEAVKILQHKDLYNFTKNAYSKSGIIGELNNAMILHFAMNSRKSEDPVSVICLSASGTGKSYLLERVAKCFPIEDIIENTQLTENSFYYFKQDEIKHKIFLIEDMDGAGNVEYPIRELISKKKISKTVTLKDTKGNLRTVSLTVEGPVTFLGATTKEKLYEDNANRCILIYLDSSAEQDSRVMHYHKEVKAGLINKQQEEKIQNQLSNIQRVLKNYKIKNPYATLIDLPQEVFKPRRTLSLLLSFIESVTNYHQLQCQKQDGALLVHPKHIEIAFELLKDSLFAKSDELSATLRNFLNQLINYTAENKKKSFYMQEVRNKLKMHPRTTQRHLYELLQFGYIKITGGNKYRKGYEYELTGMAQADLRATIDKHIEIVMKNIWQHHKEITLVGKKQSDTERHSATEVQMSHSNAAVSALSA